MVINTKIGLGESVFAVASKTGAQHSSVCETCNGSGKLHILETKEECVCNKCRGLGLIISYDKPTMVIEEYVVNEISLSIDKDDGTKIIYGLAKKDKSNSLLVSKVVAFIDDSYIDCANLDEEKNYKCYAFSSIELAEKFIADNEL